MMDATEKMPDIKAMRPFDSCVTLGRVIDPRCPECLPTAESVLMMMDRYRTAEALVHEHHARLVYPIEHGNRRLMEAIKGQLRLHPVWVLEPPKKPGRDAAKPMVEEMLAAGVRVARLRMKRVSTLPWLWDGLCAELETHRVPCFLDFGDLSTKGYPSETAVENIRQIALAHPELPMILSHIMGGLGLHPAVIPLMHRVDNVYLDIAGILEYWREVARDISPERVLFATGAPFTDPGILISNVQYARRLDEKQKAMIYGDNLRRLMEGVQ